MMSDATRSSESADCAACDIKTELEARLKFETLLADLSANFINVPASEVNSHIQEAQRRVCECLGLNTSVVWEWEIGDPETPVLISLYRPLGGPPVPERMNANTYFPWGVRQAAAGKISIVSSLNDIPKEATIDLQTHRYFGVKAALVIPLSAGGGPPFGALSFSDLLSERVWPEPLIKRLELVAQIFANAILRKRADQALRESEERLRLAADAAGVGLWSLNLATGLFWLTSKARELFDFPADEEVTFERFLGLVHPDDQEMVRQTTRTLLQRKSEGRVEYRTVRPDGSVRWMLSRGCVHYLPSGEVGGLTGVSVDMTERKRAEEEMRRLQLQLWHTDRVAQTGAITASLAHELNQPLTGILSTAQAGLRFLASGKFDSSLAHEILTNIVHDTKRAAAVINGLRAMLRRKETDREPISLADTIQEILGLLHSELLDRQVEHHLHLESDSQVMADKAQIQQVLLNLVMNALEAMQNQPPERRRVDLTLERTNTGEASVAVRDSGPGIPEEQQEKLFKAFWTTKPQGMGIGLPISTAIIESHGGHLRCNNNQNGGATFSFTLPLFLPASEPARSGSNPANPGERP